MYIDEQGRPLGLLTNNDNEEGRMSFSFTCGGSNNNKKKSKARRRAARMMTPARSLVGLAMTMLVLAVLYITAEANLLTPISLGIDLGNHKR